MKSPKRSLSYLVSVRFTQLSVVYCRYGHFEPGFLHWSCIFFGRTEWIFCQRRIFNCQGSRNPSSGTGAAGEPTCRNRLPYCRQYG